MENNNLDTLNAALFDTLEKLQTNNIEIATARAIVDTSNAITKNASLQLQAFKLTKGQISAPKLLTQKKVFSTKDTKDIHAQKTEFAKHLGYKGVVEAIGVLGKDKFNQKFKTEF